MQIDQEWVIKIAGLARLELDSTQADKFAGQFQDIIGYMDSLNQVDTSRVEPLYSPSRNKSVLREDEPQKDYQRREILTNAPRHDGEYFIVPRII